MLIINRSPILKVLCVSPGVVSRNYLMYIPAICMQLLQNEHENTREQYAFLCCLCFYNLPFARHQKKFGKVSFPQEVVTFLKCSFVGRINDRFQWIFLSIITAICVPRARILRSIYAFRTWCFGYLRIVEGGRIRFTICAEKNSCSYSLLHFD